MKKYFTLQPDEIQVANKKNGVNRLIFPVLYRTYKMDRRFPDELSEYPQKIWSYIKTQVNYSGPIEIEYNDARLGRHHQKEIRNIFNYKKYHSKYFNEIRNYLVDDVLSKSHQDNYLKDYLSEWFEKNRIERPSLEEENQILRSAFYKFEHHFFEKLQLQLSKSFITKVTSWIEGHQDEMPNEWKNINKIKQNPGAIGVNSVFDEISKLKTINDLDVPNNVLDFYPQKINEKYYNRSTTWGIWEYAKRSDKSRYALLAIFLETRRRTITDNLVELLCHIIHKLKINAEKKVDVTLLGEIKKIYSKDQILLDLAESSVKNPKGVIEDTIYPAVGGQDRLIDLIKELRTRKEYRHQIQYVLRRSYSTHYRRILPALLDVLEFRSNNTAYQPIIQSIQLIKKYSNSKIKFFPVSEDIPLEDIVPKNVLHLVIEEDSQDGARVNRINYEICALQYLKKRLSCKEVWVVGANRYKNPAEDIPKDFEENRETYYADKNLPLNAKEFTGSLKQELKEKLFALNQNIPKNPHVDILKKNNGWISLSPVGKLPDPPNLHLIKSEITKRWGIISLLDVLKEVFFKVPLLHNFKSIASREVLSQDILLKRIILSLYGIGTNTGLKRVSFGNYSDSYKNLLHTFETFISKDNIRAAIIDVVNDLFRIKNPDIWGQATTACASDSKHFGAWDQNLMSEWHVRYHGRGVMIYWHVDKNSACVHSQLKRCSSSEAASMFQGVLHHCTEMELEKNYVDTHGQSVVAFAFCKLLNIHLLPRLKNIYSQKLYLPYSEFGQSLPNLSLVLAKKSIDWELIEQEYDEMIKYATALKLGTADAESILRRFTRHNTKHPTYLALCELGKVIKTSFLCDYLMSLNLRKEIHYGLNVVENWNSMNDFILFAKGREFATNNFEHQEIIALCLHFIQNSLCYVNTLMYQDVLKDKNWLNIMSPEDFRAICPLINSHITPYGSFELNMNTRLNIGG